MTSNNSKVWFGMLYYPFKVWVLMFHTFIVTGSSSGLGKALVHAILESGQRVAATARNPAALEYLREKYNQSQLLIQALDVTIIEQVKEAFENVKQHFGRLDVVVNNAGYAVMGEIEAIPEEDARRQFEVQFWGPVNISKEGVKLFRDLNPKGQGGTFFNISTSGGYNANPTLAYYSASKFALEGFTEAFQKEMLPEWKIRAVIIEPGGFDTEWRNSSMITFPPPPEYADPNTPTMKARAIRTSIEFAGVPERAARAILKLAEEPELPMRIQLGSDSLAIIQFKANKTLQESEKWSYVAHSTNKDGLDGEAVKQKIMQFLR
ncbi:hypothetical protein BDQ17DRAFT_1345015 [Cyathus striatus]|nr:hypothetical protein BDQ17DRAFT_1345015 [Cyathus striatus]